MDQYLRILVNMLTSVDKAIRATDMINMMDQKMSMVNFCYVLLVARD